MKKSIVIVSMATAVLLAAVFFRADISVLVRGDKVYLLENSVMDTVLVYNEKQPINFECEVQSHRLLSMIESSKIASPQDVDWVYVLHVIGKGKNKMFISDGTVLFDGSEYRYMKNDVREILSGNDVFHVKNIDKCMKTPLSYRGNMG